MNVTQILQNLFEIYPSSTCTRNFSELSYEEYAFIRMMISSRFIDFFCFIAVTRLATRSLLMELFFRFNLFSGT